MKNTTQFKVGDWVKEPYTTLEMGVMVEKHQIFKLLRENSYDEGYFSTSKNLNSNEFCFGDIEPKDTWELWTPNTHELCIFHNGVSFPTTLGVINPSFKQEKGKYTCLGVPGTFEFCEPFIKESVNVFQRHFENLN